MATKEIKVKRIQIVDERFKMLLMKLIQQQTTHEAAYHINKIYKEVNRLGSEYAKLFNEFKEKYAQKTEDGKLVLGKDEEGHEVPDSWICIEGKKDDLQKDMNALNEEEVSIKYRPLTPATLKDVKISAFEIELLGEMYTSENGPGVPHGLHAIS